MKVDMIVHAGTLLTINPDSTVSHDVSIIISSGLIIDIVDTHTCTRYQADKVINAQKKIVMPGFVNTHTHIPMTYFKGLADDLLLDTWLQKYIWPAEQKCIHPELIYEATLHGVAELIKSGVTNFLDMYFLPLQTAKACHQAGIRATISDLGLDFPMGDFHKPDKNFSHIEQYKKHISDMPFVELCISAHSVYVASQKTWELAIQTARQHDMTLHTHLCETQKEVADCIQLKGRTPVKYLADLGAFEGRLVMAHGTHLSEEDFEILSDTQTSVAINLHSNLKLASGIPPISKYIQYGINVSFGTDGVASNNSLSIADEISTAAKLYKALHHDPTCLPARDLVRMATIGGAKALGQDKITGSIEKGKSADFICIDTDDFLAQPIYDPYSFIVYAMDRLSISDVVVAGKVLLQSGKLTTIDSDILLQNAKKNTQYIKKTVF
jgi:5-methylthioadenosine/S-adenosylhomocysteine deaminase